MIDSMVFNDDAWSGTYILVGLIIPDDGDGEIIFSPTVPSSADNFELNCFYQLVLGHSLF